MSAASGSVPDTHGRFGPYGGRYVPETLMHALRQLSEQYEQARDDAPFQAPALDLPQGVTPRQMNQRVSLLDAVQRRQAAPPVPAVNQFDRHRSLALALLSDPRVRSALDVTNADVRTQERYGRNSFGWSLLMARRLVELGVSFVQVNLGNNETWDTHGNAFPHLKDKLLPPTDRGMSALLDDLSERGLLDSTLIVMAGEFGRTPKISTLKEHYKLAGRDHWGAVQSVWLAGGGVQGGRVVGSSDKNGAYPATDPQTPESFAATIYQALGVPKTAHWRDAEGRPHFVYYGEPIQGLM